MDSQKNKRIKILFVCLGNICRSPAAESTFNKILIDQKLSHLFYCESRGTSRLHEGDRPDPRTIQTGEARGLKFETRSQPLTLEDLHSFDFILVMDKSNYQNVLKLSSNQDIHQKVKLLMSYAPELPYEEVPDPYYGTLKDFNLVLDLLEASCQSFLKQIKVSQ